MKTITVQVRDDHLEFLSRARPLAAIAELIWNALDAEATEVRVEFIQNSLGGVEAIRIRDNGHGLYIDHGLVAFKNLGGSWKEEGQRTATRKRILHGKHGKGRFRAFALGNHVEWVSVYDSPSGLYTYRITGRAESLGEFEVSDPAPAPGGARGMSVEIADVSPQMAAYRGIKAAQDVTDVFALYMRQYPEVHIVYDQIPLDPATAEDRVAEYDLGELVTENGKRIHAKLTIVEWLIPGKRGIFLCNESGFALHIARTRLLFRGFSYTAYLKSAYISDLEREGMLQLEDLSADVKQLLDAARTRMREHFALREAERAASLVQQWKETGLYPYDGASSTVDEESERRIFDIYATHLNQLSDFMSISHRTKRLMLRLVQELVRAEPTRMVRVFDEILSLPEDKEEEIASLAEAEE